VNQHPLIASAKMFRCFGCCSGLEFRDVERQIFLADFVGADDTALNQRPEPSIVLVWIAPTTYCPCRDGPLVRVFGQAR